jgi:hypothetical protein
MSIRSCILACAAAAATLATSAALATAVAGPEGTAGQARRSVIAAPAPGVNGPALTLITARIDKVDASGQSVTLRGQSVALHPTALRVLGPGGQPLGGPQALRAGMRVRFALEPEPVQAAGAATGRASAASDAAAPARRIVLIYVDGTS